MLGSFKHRLYPAKLQKTRIERTLDLCRWTYNQTQAYRLDARENEGQPTSIFETYNLFPAWKVERPELTRVHSQVLQRVHERIANRRYSLAHQVYLVSSFGLFAFEDLSIKNMLQNHNLSKNIIFTRPRGCLLEAPPFRAGSVNKTCV